MDNYYDIHAEEYAEKTLKADMSAVQQDFLSLLPIGGFILDCGCGAGRDTRDFLKAGYNVLPIDGSAEMCRLTTELTRVDARKMLFEEIEFIDLFDGIWASASLLHVPKEKLGDVLHRLNGALKKNGVLFMSFKYGNFEGIRDDRYYTDINDDDVESLVGEGWKMIKYYISGDKIGRDEVKWINIFMKKKGTAT